MIYMPTSLSPDKNTISLENKDILTLTAQLQLGSALEMINDTVYTDDDGKEYTRCYATLRFRINNRDYILPFDEDAYYTMFPDEVSESANTPAVHTVDIEKNAPSRTVYGKVYQESHYIRIVFEIDLNSTYSGYCLHTRTLTSIRNGESNEYAVASKSTNPNMGGLIAEQGQYAWSVRLYAKDTIKRINKGINQIGYGGLDEIENVIIDGKTNKTDEKYFKFIGTPHICIHDNVLGTNISYLDGKQKDFSVGLNFTVNNILKYIDNNAKYYLRVNNAEYPISYYRLYDAGSDFVEGFNDGFPDKFNLALKEAFDSYGNPIHGYIYIKTDKISNTTETSPDDISNAIDSGRVTKGDTYSITCNYIDSKYAYFDIEKEPVIKITENTGESLDGTSFDNPFTLTYCNLALDISFEQSEGIYSNYHNFQVYRYNKRFQRFDLEYSSSNKYNQKLICEYNKFLPDLLYMIKVNITDTVQRVHSREIYLKTDYDTVDLPQYAVAEYYKDHNSIIVDWSKIKSITPQVTGFYEYVKVSNGEISSGIDCNAVHLNAGANLNYYRDDLSGRLQFEQAALALRFKGLNTTTGNIANWICSDGFSVNIKYTNTAIVVTTSEKTYTFNLYDDYNLSQVEASLSKPVADMTVPYIYDDITKDMIWSGDYYFHTEDKISQGEWHLVVSKDCCKLKQILPDGTEVERSCIEQISSDKLFSLPRLVLFGDIIFEKIAVVNNVDSSVIDKLYSDNWNWDSNTVILNNFHYTLNGTGYPVDFRGIVGFHVYKTLGTTDDTLHEVGIIEGTKCLCLEDFVCGDNCEYTYYIYPIIKKIDKPDLYYVSSPIKTEPIKLNSGAVSLFGLKPIDDERRTFITDLDTVWLFRFNLRDSGWSINNDKTFYDTVARYNQESVGNRSYITKNIKALLGRVDCGTGGKYEEDYDMLTTWMDFVKTPQLKCLIDLRGLILPGNFEAGVSGEYMDAPGSPCSVDFTWRQKSDLNIISIHGTPLPFNPLHNTYLYSSDEYSLMTPGTSDKDYENYLLYGSLDDKGGSV